MDKQTPILVAVAEGHPVMREGFKGIIEREADLRLVAHTSDGTEALAAFRRHHPQVMLLNLRLECLDGLTVIRAVRSEYPQARLIAYSEGDRDEAVYRSLVAGARGYLPQHTSPQEIPTAIRMVSSGQRYLPPEAAMILAQRAMGQELTPREQNVLAELAQGKGNKEVAAAMGISPGTVKFHLANIMDKLAASDRTQVILIGLKRGLVSLA